MPYRRTLLALAAALALAAHGAPVAAQEDDDDRLPGPDTAAVRAFVRGPTAAEARWSEPFAVESVGRVAPRANREHEVVWIGRGAPARAAARAEPPATPAEAAPRASAPAPARPAPGEGRRTHTVAAGETFAGIAREYDVTTAQLRVLNPDVDWQNLRPGVELELPATARIAAAASAAAAEPEAARPAPPAPSPAAPPAPAAREPAPRPTPPAQRPAPATAPAGAHTHTVVAGETFLGIARRYGVTAAQLRALNPDVDWERVRIGDVLQLPASARAEAAAPAPPRDPAPAAGARTHEVQAGETLFGIARRYGVTVDALRAANRMETDQVRTGQRLVIPAS